MYRLPPAAAAFAAAVALAAAQDKPKWEPPPVPDGWRAVNAKDGTYRFAVPKETKRSGSRDRTLNSSGLRIKTHVDYFVLKDGTELVAEVATLTGTALKG